MEMPLCRGLAAITLGGVGLLLGGACTSAYAQQGTSLHDIPWYMANAQARAATRNLCHNDHRFAHDADCANAETAEDRLWGQRASNGALPGQRQTPPGKQNHLFDEYLASPTYWAENRLQRIGVLAACKNPVTGYPPDVCAAAQQGAALDSARRNRP